MSFVRLRIIFVLILAVLVTEAKIAQGTVLDEDGDPLKAVIYLQESYHWYVSTDQSGNFKLILPDRSTTDTIVIFSAGYQRIVAVYKSDDALMTFYLKRLPSFNTMYQMKHLDFFGGRSNLLEQFEKNGKVKKLLK